MALDLNATLETIKTRQWALADFDWESPGAERVRETQRSTLRNFMSDLVWIEHVGARGFAALADIAGDPTLAEIYRWFHAEEQRHANAELALMRRWGMVAAGETPEMNVNIRLAITWLDKNARSLSLGNLSAVIAMLEVALDGALVTFLLDQVEDPLCHEVFRKINADEARHLAVDFEVLDRMGMQPWFLESLRNVGHFVKPSTVLGLGTYLPLLERMRRNVLELGVDEARLQRAIARFEQIGSRRPATARYLPFKLIGAHSRMVTSRWPPYQLLANTLLAATGLLPVGDASSLPGWARSLESRSFA